MSSLDSVNVSPSLKASLNEATARYESSVADLASYLGARGISEAAAHSFRLGKCSDPIVGHERFEGMLAIPYLTPAGVVGMKFRRIDGSEGPKYDSPSGQKVRLYNAQSLSDGGDVAVVVEGELSALIAQSALSVPCVGTPGASAWLDHWPRVFADFDRVIVVADHDAKDDGTDPGVRHAKKVQKSIEGAELVLPPAGLDLDEWLERDGVEAVKKAMGL